MVVLEFCYVHFNTQLHVKFMYASRNYQCVNHECTPATVPVSEKVDGILFMPQEAKVYIGVFEGRYITKDSEHWEDGALLI